MAIKTDQIIEFISKQFERKIPRINSLYHELQYQKFPRNLINLIFQDSEREKKFTVRGVEK